MKIYVECNGTWKGVVDVNDPQQAEYEALRTAGKEGIWTIRECVPAYLSKMTTPPSED